MPWEADYKLLPCEDLFDEYLGMGRRPGGGGSRGYHRGWEGQPHTRKAFSLSIPVFIYLEA